MQALPDFRAWKPDIDANLAEMRVRWLREQIVSADEAIAAQRRIIAAEGENEAFFLSLASLEDSQRELENELVEQMQQREFEILDFALDGRPYKAHRAGAKALAIFLDRLQRLFNRVGQAVSTTRYTSVVPSHISDACRLEIAGFYPSSFGIRFAAKTSVDFTGNSIAGNALDATFDLINSDNPVEEAAKLGHVVLTNYRNLVKTLIEVEATPIAGWKTPDGIERAWNCSGDDLSILYNRLSSIHNLPPRTVDTTGMLDGASLSRHKFELICEYGKITGKAPAELADKVRNSFGKPVRVTYVETTFIDESTDQKKHSRTLVDIDPI